MDRTAVIEVSGVHWASSKAVTAAVLSRRSGVLAVDANPVSQTATVTYDPDVTSVAALAGWVRNCGYHCAGQSVPDHVCDPMAEPGPPLSARIKIQDAAEGLDYGTHVAGVDDFVRAGGVDPLTETGRGARARPPRPLHRIFMEAVATASYVVSRLSDRHRWVSERERELTW